MLRTRFAPSVTGHLHLGHVLHALWVWGMARTHTTQILLRMEDHDRERYRSSYEDSIRKDLDWLGLEADYEVPRQSDRYERYKDLLAELKNDNRVYVCNCSRKTIRKFYSKKESLPCREKLVYPNLCREKELRQTKGCSLRFCLPNGKISFEDKILGTQTQWPEKQCGDFVLQDAKGNYSYHFAVVADDMDQGVDFIIRGSDILSSTGRQISLGKALGRTIPARYLHHPLIMDKNGQKLSKGDHSAGIRELRTAGWSAGKVLGEAAFRGGLLEEFRTLTVDELPELFRNTPPFQDSRGED